MLIGLKQYFDYLIEFTNIDRDNDRTLTFSEFSQAQEILEKWGTKIENLREAFNEIDTDFTGKIDFKEFCSWAISKSFGIKYIGKEDAMDMQEPHWRKMLKSRNKNNFLIKNKQDKIIGRKLRQKKLKYKDIN